MSASREPSRRLAKVNELLKRELSAVLERTAEWPSGVLVTITEVDVAADLQHATVWVSILPEAQAPAVFPQLTGRAGELHRWLYRQLRFRPIPALYFRLDTTGVRGAEVEALLDRLATAEGGSTKYEAGSTEE